MPETDETDGLIQDVSQKFYCLLHQILKCPLLISGEAVAFVGARHASPHNTSV